MQEPEKKQPLSQVAESLFEQYAGLPFAVCLFRPDGLLLRFNEAGRRLFELTETAAGSANIQPLFINEGDYPQLITRLQGLSPGQWLNETILDLNIEGRITYVRIRAIAIRDEKKSDLAGVLGLMSASTKSARYHRLFSELPIGIFCLRFPEGLVNANPRFLEMHGYSSFEEIQYQSAEYFMNDIIEVKELEHRVRTEGKVTNQLQEHRRKGGSIFMASMSAKAIYDHQGEVIGLEGIVEDVSNEDIYFKMVDNVPMGLYKIRINDQGEHILVHCNQQFAQHLGATFPTDLIGKDIRQFHRTEQTFHRFHDQLLQKDQEGHQLIDHIVELVDINGHTRRHEVHSNLLKDANGQIIGRVGAERDVTDLWETRQQLNELTTDIGKVLHSYSSTLIHSKHSMEAVIRSFGEPDQLTQPGNLPDSDQVYGQIIAETSILKTLLEKLLENNDRRPQMEIATVQQLEHLINLIQPRSKDFDMRQLALTRDGSVKIKTLIQTLTDLHFPKESIKQIRRQLDEILRLCSLLTLSAGIEAILEMETNVNSLRSYILTRVKPKEEPQRIDVYDLLIGVIKNMTEYAANRNIELRLNANRIRNTSIQGNETDLMRTLLNLLHNAIKYSWVRKKPAKAFVQIEGRIDSDWLYLSVENWGVAITEEEIQKGLIFQVGYRGANASDRRRPGTGLGLYDAKKVIEKHDGQMTVTSQPSMGNPKDDYSKPFITTVTIQLPRDHNT